MNDIIVSIVVPSLNEEITIGEFVKWCKEGLEKANVKGEILIVDSSTDKTAEIAESLGARVLRVPKRGLGQAYIDALPEIKGKYVILGDCDLTYDFREIKAFIEKLDEGYEYVMGTRIKGTIEKDAMPNLHRYFGTPLTTAILNILYGSHYSDIQCGMRAMTLDALKKINLESPSWEYAPEMVLKSVKLGLKTTEVPIKFYKDREGRVSHFKRTKNAWLSPWKIGWMNLRVILEYTPQSFLKMPGLIMSFIGVALIALVLIGRVFELTIIFTLHSLLLGSLLLTVGVSFYELSILSEIYFGFDVGQVLKYRKRITYNRLMSLVFVFGIIGLAGSVVFVKDFIMNDFIITGIAYSLIFSIASFIACFQFFTFALLFQMLTKKRNNYNSNRGEV